MEPINCLNCDTSFSGNFCPNCGQKASTRRYSWSYVFSKDFLTDIFNFDSGFLLMAKQLFYRPGHVVNEYLQGKRKTYFNAIGFLLILLTIEAILWSMAQNSVAEILTDNVRQQLAQAQPDLAMVLSVEDVEGMLRNQKIIFLLAVPLAGFFSWLIFRRLNYNYLEHNIMVILLLAMNTLIGLGIGLVGLLPISMGVFKTIYYSFSAIVLVYDFILIWQFSKRANYQRGGRIWRSLLTLICVTGIIGITLNIAIGFFQGNRTAADQDKMELVE